MRKSTKILSGLALGGLIAAGGSAFTATSSIDSSQKYVGSVGQAISGVHVDSVHYTVNGSDLTTAVAFHVSETLASGDTVTATISNNAQTPASDTAVCDKTAAVSPATGTDLQCTFTDGVTNTTSLTITTA